MSGVNRDGPRHGKFDDYFDDDFVRVVRCVIKAGFSIDEARDAAAESMTQAFEQWEKIESPPRWVRTVALRTALRAARRGRVERARAIVGWSGPERSDEGAEVIARTDSIALLRRLPPRQRLVMTCHLEGMTEGEIAELGAMKPATVRSHLRHARQTLEAAIAEMKKLERGGE